MPDLSAPLHKAYTGNVARGRKPSSHRRSEAFVHRPATCNKNGQSHRAHFPRPLRGLSESEVIRPTFPGQEGSDAA